MCWVADAGDDGLHRLPQERVAAAVAAVQPYGLDLCSGVRTDGRLDAQKLAAFFEQLTS